MKTIRRLLGLTLLFLLIVVAAASAQQEQQEESIIVGHISHVEGELLRYVPEEEDWVSAIPDTPVGKDEVFYAADEVKAELIFPNNTWIRIGNNVQIEVIDLEDDTTEVTIDSGVARFYNKSSTTEFKVTTPYGQVVAPPGSTFDVYLKEESVEVIALKGRVQFVHVAEKSQYEVISGSSSVVANYQEITSGTGIVDEDWHAWNAKMDAQWDKRLEKEGDSAKYLPERLYYESHVLDDHGVWERVYYEGRYCNFWRPAYVSAGWSPFSVGRWSLWHDDHCWVPREPFGYVTHHYGNWIYATHRHRWYWAPPVNHVRIGVGPFLQIGFSWYPGRVSWIHRGSYIGWIPLGPFERYYTRRCWGPRSTVFNRNHIIKLKNHRYRDHAVIVKQRHFYDVNNYKRFRRRHIRKSSILDSYRATPVINSRVIRGFKKTENRFKFGNVEARRKPHRSVIEKVNHRRSDRGQFFKAGGSSTRAVKTTPAKRERQNLFRTPGVSKKIISPGEFKPSERKRSKRRQQKTPGSITKRRKPGQRVKAVPMRRVRGITAKPAKNRSRTLVTPGMRVQKSTSRPGKDRFLRKITPGKKVRSFTSRPFIGKSRPRMTTRSTARRTTPKLRVRGSPRRSGSRMR